MPCWAFSSRKSRFRGLAAPQPGDVRGFPRPGQVAFAAAELLFPKSFNWGSKIHSGVEGGRHGVELVFSRTYFLQNEFYSSPLKSSVEHVDVDYQRFHLRRLLKNIGTRFRTKSGFCSKLNDLKLDKSSKRSYFGSRGNQRRQQRVAERRQRGAAPPFPTTAHEVAPVLLVAGRRS